MSTKGAVTYSKVMVQRVEDRGDLVGSIVWYGFWGLLAYLFITGVFGGAMISYGAADSNFSFVLSIPHTDGNIITGLIAPLAMHVAKRAFEITKGGPTPPLDPPTTG